MVAVRIPRIMLLHLMVGLEDQEEHLAVDLAEEGEEGMVMLIKQL